MEFQGFEVVSKQRQKCCRNIAAVSIAVFAVTNNYKLDYKDFNLAGIKISENSVEFYIGIFLACQMAILIVTFASDFWGKRPWNTREKLAKHERITDKNMSESRTSINKFWKEFKIQEAASRPTMAPDKPMRRGLEQSLERNEKSLKCFNKLLEKSMKCVDRYYKVNWFLFYIMYGVIPFGMCLVAIVLLAMN